MQKALRVTASVKNVFLIGGKQFLSECKIP